METICACGTVSSFFHFISRQSKSVVCSSLFLTCTRICSVCPLKSKPEMDFCLLSFSNERLRNFGEERLGICLIGPYSLTLWALNCPLRPCKTGTSAYAIFCAASCGSQVLLGLKERDSFLYILGYSIKEKEPDKHSPHCFWSLLLQSRVKLLEKITEEHKKYSANINQFQSWLNGVTERLNCCIGETTKSSAEDRLKALKVLNWYNFGKEAGLCVFHACMHFSSHTRVCLRKELYKVRWLL